MNIKVRSIPISFMAVVRPGCSVNFEHNAAQCDQTSILKQWSKFDKQQISGKYKEIFVTRAIVTQTNHQFTPA